jgi:hypothetical protein
MGSEKEWRMESGEWRMKKIQDDNSQLSIFDSQVIPKGYRRTEVGVIPEEWEVTPPLSELSIYGEFATIRSPRISKGWTP